VKTRRRGFAAGLLVIAVLVLAAYLAGCTSVTSSSSLKAAAPVPVPAALAGRHFVSQVTPSQMTTSRWDQPGNDPGNCPGNPGAVHLDAAGDAELDTTGKRLDCTSVQSPTVTATGPGFVYEARVFFSTFDGVWPAVWMYGSDWPAQGEVDAVEDNFGVSYLSWHYRSCNPVAAASSEISTNPWSYQCKADASPPASPDITAGNWHTVDIAFTSDGFSVYYDGRLFDSVKENLTPAGDDPMWFTVSEGSCEGQDGSECNGPPGPGNVKVRYIRVFR